MGFRASGLGARRDWVGLKLSVEVGFEAVDSGYVCRCFSELLPRIADLLQFSFEKIRIFA